jgi:hypothetical protein
MSFTAITAKVTITAFITGKAANTADGQAHGHVRLSHQQLHE